MNPEDIDREVRRILAIHLDVDVAEIGDRPLVDLGSDNFSVIEIILALALEEHFDCTFDDDAADRLLGPNVTASDWVKEVEGVLRVNEVPSDASKSP